jgi:hypothetical protein
MKKAKAEACDDARHDLPLLVDAGLAELAPWINAGRGNALTIGYGAGVIVKHQIGWRDFGSVA